MVKHLLNGSQVTSMVVQVCEEMGPEEVKTEQVAPVPSKKMLTYMPQPFVPLVPVRDVDLFWGRLEGPPQSWAVIWVAASGPFSLWIEGHRAAQCLS